VAQNLYAEIPDLRVALTIPGIDEDPKLLPALLAASRDVDHHCDRRFWQDSAVKTRVYWPDDNCEVVVDDISTLTGLVVKTDTGDDGTYATTLTIGTDFIVLPPNAEDEDPAEPYTMIRLVNPSYSLPTWGSGRPSVQVVAKFGWAAIPDEVMQATVIQATQLYKAPAAAFGGIQLGIDGSVLRVRSQLNPMAAELLQYRVRHDAPRRR
jgi:hypothetical protein